MKMIELDSPSLTDNQYSYQHAKAFGAHNHLFVDPCLTSDPSGGGHDLVYLIDDDHRVLCYSVEQNSREIGAGHVVYEIPCDHFSACGNRLSATLMFADSRRAVIADGCGKLLLLNTGDTRLQKETWTMLYTCDITTVAPSTSSPTTPTTTTTTVYPSKLLDCSSFNPNHHVDNPMSPSRVECLCLSVEPVLEAQLDDTDTEGKRGAAGDCGPKSTSAFHSTLYWFNLEQDDKGSWFNQRTRTLRSTCPPDFASFPTSMGSQNRLVISSQKPFSFISDSLTPVLPEPVETEEERELRECPPAYTWCQTQHDICAQFTLPLAWCSKSLIVCNLTSDTIELAIKGGDSLLCGDLPEKIDVEFSNWTLEDQRLEVNLEKKRKSMWPIMVCGDTRGKMCLSNKQREIIHNRLQMMSQNRDDVEFKKPAYNTQELEECDRQHTDGATIVCFHGDTHKQLTQTDLSGNQWLFNCLVEPSMTFDPNTSPSSSCSRLTPVDLRPALCIRHDVDGLVVECSNSDPAYTHVAAFNALGYVMASKNAKKFTLLSPDLSYCAIADSKKHVYVYWKETAVQTALRNRKTGQGVPSVARQQLLSLAANKHGESESIMGIQLLNKRMFLLTTSMLSMVQMSS